MPTYEDRSGKVRARFMHNGRRYSRTFDDRAAAEAWCARHKATIQRREDAGASALLSQIPRRILDAVQAIDYTATEVVSGALPVGGSVGIYFLVRDAEVVYIGKTTDVFLRLSKHRRDGKQFDAYNFLPCGEADLDRLESLYITALLPYGNLRL